MQLILILLLLCLCPASMAEGNGNGQFALTVDGGEEAVLMEEAEVSGRQIAVYAPGTWVCVLSTQDEWAYVQSQDGAVGFMEKSALENVHISYRLYGVVHNPSDREFLNLREEPSREAATHSLSFMRRPIRGSTHTHTGI